MAISIPFNPSIRTWRRLALATVVAGLITFWFQSANYDCGAQVWTCKTFAGIAVVSAMFGLAFAATYTALAVLLGPVVKALRPAAIVLEASNKAIAVAVALFVLQVSAVGALHLLGALPAAWPRWLGIFGAYLA